MDNNHIDDTGLKLLIQSLALRHDSKAVRSMHPIKLLRKVNLSNNQLSDKSIAKLLDALLTYTPLVEEVDLSRNKLTNECCAAVAAYLDEIDDWPKKQRCLRRFSLRPNQIDFDGVQQLNEAVADHNESWSYRIELGSNPTKQMYSFDEHQKVKVDHRITLHGK